MWLGQGAISRWEASLGGLHSRDFTRMSDPAHKRDRRDTSDKQEPPDQPLSPDCLVFSLLSFFFLTDSSAEQKEQSTSEVQVLGRTSCLTTNDPGGDATLAAACGACPVRGPLRIRISPTLPAEAGPGPQLGGPTSTRPRAQDGAVCAPSTSQPQQQGSNS